MKLSHLDLKEEVWESGEGKLLHRHDQDFLRHLFHCLELLHDLLHCLDLLCHPPDQPQERMENEEDDWCPCVFNYQIPE